MKRRLLIAAVFLLAGAVVNVAVAWGCVLLFRTTMPDFDRWGRPSLTDAHWWDSHRSADSDDELVTVYVNGGRGWRMVRLDGFPRATKEGQENIIATRIISGFPADSFDGEIWRIGWKRHLRTEGITKIGDVFLPIRPRPVALAINTLFYATLLWLPICGPIALRRFIRTRRGLCPACAYPRGESDVCSECGKELAT